MLPGHDQLEFAVQEGEEYDHAFVIGSNRPKLVPPKSMGQAMGHPRQGEPVVEVDVCSNGKAKSKCVLVDEHESTSAGDAISPPYYHGLVPETDTLDRGKRYDYCDSGKLLGNCGDAMKYARVEKTSGNSARKVKVPSRGGDGERTAVNGRPFSHSLRPKLPEPPRPPGNHDAQSKGSSTDRGGDSDIGTPDCADPVDYFILEPESNEN